jgi:hypothetical protein
VFTQKPLNNRSSILHFRYSPLPCCTLTVFLRLTIPAAPPKATS